MRRLTWIAFGCAFIAGERAQAQLITSATWSTSAGGNGHRYEVYKVAGGITWSAARSAALAAGGHLATCTTAAENDFVFGLVNDPQVWALSVNSFSIGPWLGGVQPGGSPEPAGGWQWDDGEAWSYTRWAPGEPNEACSGVPENSLCYWNNSMLPAPVPVPTWNDLPDAGCGGAVIAYVVEVDFATICAGDGSVIACPCANQGAAGNGCANSVFAAGSRLDVSGVSSVANDSIALAASGMTGSIAIFFQGASQTSASIVDDGVGCVGGTILRLGSKSIVSGSSSYPQPGDASIGVAGALPAAGGTFYYQAVYRNSAAAFCPPATSNRTNAIAIPWGA